MGPRYTLVIRYWCDAWALQACGAELPWSVQPTQALRYAGSGSSAKRADSSAKIKLVAKIRPTWHWYWPYDLTNICPYNSKHIEMYFNIFPFTDYISDISKIWVQASSKVSWSGIVSLWKAVFKAVFWRKSSFSPISAKCRPPLHLHRWKAMDLSFLTV